MEIWGRDIEDQCNECQIISSRATKYTHNGIKNKPNNIALIEIRAVCIRATSLDPNTRFLCITQLLKKNGVSPNYFIV